MAALGRWMRPLRRAAWRAGLVADRTRFAARAVERLLDTQGASIFAASGVPGLVVVVRFAEGRTIRRAFGTADGTAPMRPDTVFAMLSLSKPVTAMCALSLVDAGVLALDEPVWRRIRSWRLPPHRSGGGLADGITLRRLLSHDAGLNVIGYGQRKAGEAPGAAELLAREDEEARTLRIVKPPGSGFAYSGGAFVLVQLLIEDATGRPFVDVVRERVLRPLGMTSSDYELTPDLARRLATAHDMDGRPLPRGVFAATAASSLFGTADDLATFWSAFTVGPAGEPPGRGVVSPETCALMLVPRVADEAGGGWGLGLRMKSKRSDVRYGHGGYDDVWHSYAEGLLRRRVVFVVLSNGSRGKDAVPLLSRRLRLRLYDVAL